MADRALVRRFWRALDRLASAKDRDMVKLGYKLMAEEHGPSALVRHTVRAEQAGFAFAAISDHFFPWLDEQGYAPLNAEAAAGVG
jgi:alkanesulfonate monooxygenase SsuD/methylene tetrahydromethanopterin reductase-like flavin-dependent oxidoreductase (luciferase family)